METSGHSVDFTVWQQDLTLFLLFLEDAELFGHKRCLHHRKAKKLKDGKSPSLTFSNCGFVKCKNVGGLQCSVLCSACLCV